MVYFRIAFLLFAATAFATGASSAPSPHQGNIVFSDLCRNGDAFSGSRLTLTLGLQGDTGIYQWGDTAAATAPLDQLAVGADGTIAFRYMPDADNPEVFVQVKGRLDENAFTGTADGKPLKLARTPNMGSFIPACK